MYINEIKQCELRVRTRAKKSELTRTMVAHARKKSEFTRKKRACALKSGTFFQSAEALLCIKYIYMHTECCMTNVEHDKAPLY